jgi:hypothetical protein
MTSTIHIYGDWLVHRDGSHPQLRVRIAEIAAYKLNGEFNTRVWLKSNENYFEISGDATQALDKVLGLDNPSLHEVPIIPRPQPSGY